MTRHLTAVNQIRWWFYIKISFLGKEHMVSAEQFILDKTICTTLTSRIYK